MSNNIRLGVDTGGTFTDLCLVDEAGGQVRVAKVSSTPHDPAEAVINGLNQLVERGELSPEQIGFFIHGTTVATNALLESKGAPTALITTEGFEDVLLIGRQSRPKLYDFWAQRPRPIVPRSRSYGVPERVLHDGTVLKPLDEDSVCRALEEIKAQGVNSIAVCLIHSYANPAHESRIKDLAAEIHPQAMVTISSEVLPEYREYERMSTICINAYVMPKVNTYVAHLQDLLARMGVGSELYIMQSNGGVITAETARHSSARTALSGPAGGVLTGVQLAQKLNQPNQITIDIGGTSSDICLIDGGRPNLTTETDIEGYPIKLPMIDINTIGAGGGSIAWIDPGGALRVGPESAGAAPGPVCYARGGTVPTVTDANVILGRINPEYLLGGRMQVDLEGARRAVQEVIAEPLGLDLITAAAGIIEVINANMIRGIRRVSVERGYDPRDFALVPFGGAGPLHGVELARALNMTRIIVPAHPGIASAVGMLTADVRHDYVQTFIAPAKEADLSRLSLIYSDMETRGKAQLCSEGFMGDTQKLVYSADMRYAGQSYELPLELPSSELSPADLAQLIQGFHQRHKQAYGYAREEAPVELVNLRLTALGLLPQADGGLEWPQGETEPRPIATRQVYFDGGMLATPIYKREQIHAGQNDQRPGGGGAAGFHHRDSPGISGSDRKGGQYDHRGGAGMIQMDPITLEVMRNAFQSAAEEMGAALIRTALSPNIKDRRDCSTGVYSADGELVAQAEHIPLHLGLMPSVVKSTLSYFPIESLRPGDAIITNDPYVSGSHLPDICIISPFFHKGQCLGIVANLAHHVDIGGIAPGGMPTISTEIFQEGIRIPPIRIMREGQMVEEVMALLATNVRTSRELTGDIQAQLAANNVGQRRLLEIVQKYGPDKARFYMDELVAYSERRMRARIKELPFGKYEFTDYLEGDGLSNKRLTIKVRLELKPDGILVDFTGTSPQTKGSVNCTRAVTLACTYYAPEIGHRARTAFCRRHLPGGGSDHPGGLPVEPQLSGPGFKRQYQHLPAHRGCGAGGPGPGPAQAGARRLQRLHGAVHHRRPEPAHRRILFLCGNLWRRPRGHLQPGRHGRCAHQHDQHPQHPGGGDRDRLPIKGGALRPGAGHRRGRATAGRPGPYPGAGGA